MQLFKNIKSLNRVNRYFWKYRKQLFWGITFVTISNFFAVIPAQVLRYALDLVAESIFYYKTSEGFSVSSLISGHFTKSLLIYAAIIIVMAFLRGFFMFMMRQTIIVMSRKVEFDMKNDLYAHFQKLSLSFYKKNNTGDLMARISEDIGRVRMFVGPAIMYSINLATLIILVISIMLTVNVKLTFYVLLPLPVLSVLIYYVNSIIHQRSMKLQGQLSRITTFVQEMFSGIRVIKSFASEKSVKKHFEEEVDLYKMHSLRLARVDAMFNPLILLLMGASILITLYVGGQEVMKGNMTPGNIAEFFMYVNVIAWPVASIGWVTSLIQRAAASQKRINELMEVRPEILWKQTDKADVKGEIQFRDVNFYYPETNIKVLDNINIHIRPGESLGIIGHTGSGKSTFANLILRAYDTSTGTICIDGADIREINLGQFRANIGYVPQDDFLFSESIKNNILFGYHGHINPADFAQQRQLDELVENAAKIADVYKDIQEFPDGFNTMLGERGITLSGGQKQRVAIARAIVQNPKILILDDCFSAIDTNTEARILQQLSDVMLDKTSVIISHRVSTVKNATYIIVLSAGQIIEEGKHEDLIKKEGYYYTLYRKQLVEKELFERQKLELE